MTSYRHAFVVRGRDLSRRTLVMFHGSTFADQLAFNDVQLTVGQQQPDGTYRVQVVSTSRRSLDQAVFALRSFITNQRALEREESE